LVSAVAAAGDFADRKAGLMAEYAPPFEKVPRKIPARAKYTGVRECVFRKPESKGQSPGHLEQNKVETESMFWSATDSSSL
jgi:hypothetical protein